MICSGLPTLKDKGQPFFVDLPEDISSIQICIFGG
jgi:hypothetical protein